MKISEMLIKQVNEKGWLSIANLMFEDGVPVLTPITSGGMICLSPSEELVFAASIMDTHNTYVIENGYIAQDYTNSGVQQTIIINPFDRMRQFETLMMSQYFRKNAKGEKFVGPVYPKVADVEAMAKDPATGLYPNTDTVITVRNKEESTLSLYPDDATKLTYAGLRVENYQTFIKTQKAFCALIGDMYGIKDCI